MASDAVPLPRPPGSAPPLGFGPMDSVHHEFVQVVAAARAADDAVLPECLAAVVRHLHEHFSAEDAWMRESAFPAGDCHMDEHAAVLKSAAEVTARLAAGDVAIARDFLAELDGWFPAHADYLDSALAAWLCKRRYGGTPVVLHRTAARGQG